MPKSIAQQFEQALHDQSTDIGKRIGQHLYIHVSVVCSSLQALLDLLSKELNFSLSHINVLRLDCRAHQISLMEYSRFFEVGFPELKKSYTVNISPLKISSRSHGKNGNPPILHRKELLLSPKDPNYQTFQSLTLQAEQYGLLKNTQKIGYKKYWEELLSKHEVLVLGHSIVLKIQD